MALVAKKQKIVENKTKKDFINEEENRNWDGGYNDITTVFIGDNQTLILITNGPSYFK